MATNERHEGERGQLVAFFAIVLVVIIGAVGLVLDGGGAFVQRREQQNVADAAAMAAGIALINHTDVATAAQTVAAANGYTNGVNGVTVAVTSTAVNATVSISKPHQNYFAGILGASTWMISTEATVLAGVPNGALGAMPIIFNQRAFNKLANKSADSPVWFDEPPSGSSDIPVADNAFNWTVFCTAGGSSCNADSTTVENLINGNGTAVTVFISDGIAPLNAGSHATLFSDMAAHVGEAYPVPIVNDAGEVLGWSTFHITGSVGGSTKQIGGWFEDKVDAGEMTISPTGGAPIGVFGSYVVKLSD